MAGTESQAAEARQAERDALDRPTRAEGEAAWLREQLGQLSVTFQEQRAAVRERATRAGEE